MEPLVSVVIAVYNGEKYLSEAIESVVEQTYPFVEIILVNDGSTDRTEAIAQKYGSTVRYFYQMNRGQPAALNQGVLEVRGDYITFLDADDVYFKDKILSQVKFLEKRREIDFIFGYVEQFISPELEEGIRKKWACPSKMSPCYLAATGLFRKECFDRAGLFNEEQKIGAFIEWYMRAEEKGLKNEVASVPVLRRRIHDHNMGIQFQHARLEYVKIVKAALKRRGALIKDVLVQG